MKPPIPARAVPVAVPTVTGAGAIAHMVRVRAIPAPGPDLPVVTGLPEPAGRATRDRLQAAIVNAGLQWPRQPIELSVFPHPLPAGDAGLDAAFGVALLAATDQVPRHMLTDLAVIGELGLDGSLRPVPDLAARLAVAAQAGFGHVVLPASYRAASRRGLVLHPVAHLRQLADLLNGWPQPGGPSRRTWGPGTDLVDLSAAHPDRRILEIAAAGGHHLALFGPVGSGKAMLAHRLPALLPDLDARTAGVVADLYRTAGQPEQYGPAERRPPWQAPHHTMSLPALLGNPRRPGTVSLAHGGVLYCDDAGELPSAAVDALCTVLDQRRVVLGPARTVYPARFQLVLATTGCPQPDPGGARCGCPPGGHRRYLARLSRLLDRVDIHATLPAMTADPAAAAGESSADVVARVAQARAVAAARWARHRGATNRDVGSTALHASLTAVPARRLEPLRAQVAAGAVSTRGAVSVLRLAWTIADLAGHTRPTAADVTEAVALRTNTTTG